jgi:cysteine-rich repeat protein
MSVRFLKIVTYSQVFCVSLGILFALTLYNTPLHIAQGQYVATTSVSLTVCGDALIAPSEFCDDGTNTGAYANSIVGRNCDPLCSAWGPYCGDSVVQVFYGEECDDGNNDAGDYCDATCQNETTPVVIGGSGSGGSGGGGGRGSGNRGIPGASTDGEIDFEGDTDVNVFGRAYPGATITVLRDGEIERVVEADSSAEFDFTLSDLTPGITTLGFWALDNANRRSVTYAATFQVVQNAVTTLSGVLIPPTIAVVPEQAPPGSTVSFEGSALPSSNVFAYVDDAEVGEETFSAINGDWGIAYDTTGLGVEAFHTVKANYIDPDDTDLKSGFSLIANFYVGNRDVDTNLTADLNFDGFVNLTDFSILLFNWNGTGGVADINQDGTVSLADFSIMLFYWTG